MSLARRAWVYWCRMSLPYAVLVTLKSVVAVSHMQKPLWFLAVTVT